MQIHSHFAESSQNPGALPRVNRNNLLCPYASAAPPLEGAAEGRCVEQVRYFFHAVDYSMIGVPYPLSGGTNVSSKSLSSEKDINRGCAKKREAIMS